MEDSIRFELMIAGLQPAGLIRLPKSPLCSRPDSYGQYSSAEAESSGNLTLAASGFGSL